MSSLAPSLLQVLQPPYGWILMVVLAMPFWVVFTRVFLRGFEHDDQGVLLRFHNGKLERIPIGRDLVRYAALLTAVWLLIVSFKVYQQYFTQNPLTHSSLGVFDLALGLFCLASWAAVLSLKAQQRLDETP